MRIIFFLIRKEFRQIFRNRSMLPIIFVMPIVQLLILANAATFEVRQIKLYIIDQDHTPYARLLISKFAACEYFTLVAQGQDDAQARDAMQQGRADVILEIPRHFERRWVNQEQASLLLAINAIDGASAAVENAYATAIIRDFNQQIVVEYAGALPAQRQQMKVVSAFWFNPDLAYKTYMVPGILVVLITMVTLFLAGMNIVREKEIGTLEQINVTPIKKHHFIIGKLFPFWLLGLFELAFGLGIGRVIFDIPMVGSLGVVFLFAAIYLMAVLGIGFFISNFTDTQQQAMFLSWFCMVIFILMSGLFTPIESMPTWAQRVTLLNPVRYFVEIMRMVMLKGARLSDITTQLGILIVYAAVMNLLAILSYRKTT